MKLIDLSVTIEHDAVSEMLAPKIAFPDHTEYGGSFFKEFFGATDADLVWSSGTGPADEIFTFMSHTGTHVDAPLHYAPSSADGAPAMSIDEAPLEWFHSDGVVLDMRHKRPGELIERVDLEGALA